MCNGVDCLMELAEDGIQASVHKVLLQILLCHRVAKELELGVVHVVSLGPEEEESEKDGRDNQQPAASLQYLEGHFGIPTMMERVLAVNCREVPKKNQEPTTIIRMMKSTRGKKRP